MRSGSRYAIHWICSACRRSISRDTTSPPPEPSSGVLVFGPSQVDNRIEQNALISQQLTLWDTAGSEVRRSTLMMVPVGDSFLYVQPVYLQAAGGRMPELRRVSVANGSSVAMEETFDRALEVVTGQRAAAGLEAALPAEGPPDPGA